MGKIYKRKERGTWRIVFFDRGKRYREDYPTKETAKKMLIIREEEVLRGKYNFEMEQHSPKFENFVRDYLEYAKINKRSWIRDKQIIQHLLTHFEGLKLSQIFPDMIEAYKMARTKQVSPATVNREVACLKHMFNLAIKWKKTSINPVKEVRFFREEKHNLRWLTEREEERLLPKCFSHLRPVVIVAIYTGMRKGELMDLTWDKIDFDKNTITVDRTKIGEGRRLPMNKTMKETLLTLKLDRPDAKYVFGKRDEPIGNFKKAWNAAVRRAGIPQIRFHDLRHTFGTRLALKGVDIKTIMELMGHKEISTTLRYMHSSQGHKKEAVDLLDLSKNLSKKYLSTAPIVPPRVKAKK